MGQKGRLRAAAAALAAAVAIASGSCSRSGTALESLRDSFAAACKEASAGGVPRGADASPGASVSEQAPAADAAAPAAPQEAAARAQDEAQIAQKPAAVERMRVYSGYARLAVDAISEARQRLAELAEQWGGYVEMMKGDTVVIRVPAARFRESFARAQELGRVLERRVETYDVTEQYQDLSGRLDIARRTRDRLYALLERTQDVKERVQILREIRRLSEAIERLGLTMDLISRQVAFSRITVLLEGRLGEEQRARREIPFAWIAALDPVYASLGRLKARVRLDLGSDFAVFSAERAYRAESADGTRVRVATAANKPQGDARFWQEALVHALSPLYRSAERVQLGPAGGVLFTSKDREPFAYLVAVVPRGRKLHVVEVFYPGAAARERRTAAVEAALARLEVR